MVRLTVKGTQHPDEFTYECACADSIATVCDAVTTLLNTRHLINHQLFSGTELVPAAKRVDEEKGKQYEDLLAEVRSLMKSPTTPVLPSQFVAYWAQLHDRTAELFPSECFHKDGEEAAVDQLYAMHENPDIDEDYRLHIYHCRAMMDPKYRSNELIDVETSALWFCGKEMPKDQTIGKWCSNNEKSKLTVKVSKSGATAPSKEPRLGYEQQRLLRDHLAKRREEFATLEEPELRDRVLAKSKAAIRSYAAQPATAAPSSLRTDGLRPIYSGATVTESDATA